MLALAAAAVLAGCGQAAQENIQTSQESEETVSGNEAGSFSGEDISAGQKGENGSAESHADRIYIYICGAVNTPGVYQLPGNSRVCDAVAAAGGMTEEADLTHVNQAKLLTDGEQITVLSKDEAAGTQPGTAVSADGETALININTADEKVLQELSGIGETKAAAIVEYRESNGAFRTIEEITKVSGIGQGLYDRIRDKITVS